MQLRHVQLHAHCNVYTAIFVDGQLPFLMTANRDQQHVVAGGLNVYKPMGFSNFVCFTVSLSVIHVIIYSITGFPPSCTLPVVTPPQNGFQRSNSLARRHYRETCRSPNSILLLFSLYFCNVPTSTRFRIRWSACSLFENLNRQSGIEMVFIGSKRMAKVQNTYNRLTTEVFSF